MSSTILLPPRAQLTILLLQFIREVFESRIHPNYQGLCPIFAHPTTPPPPGLGRGVGSPGWCGWAVASLLRRCCGGAVFWRPVISLPSQSVVVGEVGRCVGVLWRAGVCVGVLRTGPIATGVRVYTSVV